MNQREIQTSAELSERVAQLKRDVIDTLILVVDFQASIQGELSPELGTHGKRLVAGLYASCFGVFRGVTTLLAEDMTHEALMLHRTLIQDSTTLAYFHKHSNRLEEVALAYAYSSFLQQKGLEEEAASLGLPRPEKIQEVEDMIADVRQAGTELGIAKIKKLPQLRAMLRELNFMHLYWSYKEASMVVHSATLALGSRLASAAIDFAEEHPYDATATYKLGRNCAESFLTANIATAHLLSLGNVSKWSTTREQTRQIMARLREENSILSAARVRLGL